MSSVAEEGMGIAKLAGDAAEWKGSKAIIVNYRQAALRLLQPDAKQGCCDGVLLDDELPAGLMSSRCVARFREWEEKNGVNRQNNVIQMSSSLISFPTFILPRSYSSLQAFMVRWESHSL